jgi:hypothetical protein
MKPISGLQRGDDGIPEEVLRLSDLGSFADQERCLLAQGRS